MSRHRRVGMCVWILADGCSPGDAAVGVRTLGGRAAHALFDLGAGRDAGFELSRNSASHPGRIVAAIVISPVSSRLIMLTSL